MKKNPIPIAAAAAPTPIPAFAPVDMPVLEEEESVRGSWGVGIDVLV